MGNFGSRSFRIAVVGSSLALLIGAASGFAQMYNLVELGTITGGAGAGAVAFDITVSGQIVGSGGLTNGVGHAVVWTNNSSSPIDLGTFTISNSLAYAMNASGTIVGFAQFSPGSFTVAAVWTNTHSAPMELANFGSNPGEARSINSAGQIVGYSQVANMGEHHATFWTNSASGAIDLGTLGGDNSDAQIINSSGQIAGSAQYTVSKAHAVFWTNSRSAPIDLGTLGGSNSAADGMNDSGQIVGTASLSNSTIHAALWTNSSSPAIDLGTLGGSYSNSTAGAINNTGQIVGLSSSLNGVLSRAVFWASRTNSLVDLNTLIPTNSGMVLLAATAINDFGEIVGVGRVGAQTNAFALLLPTTPSVSINVISTNVALSYTTNTNDVYDVQQIDDLVSGSWSTVASNIAGTGRIITNTFVGAASVPKRFYRVGVSPSP